MIYYLVLVLFLGLNTYIATKLVINLSYARKSKLPIVISPIDAVNPVWILSQDFLLPLINRLPSLLRAWTRYNHRGWLFKDKYRMHAELGEAWIHVTPGTRTVYLADVTACQEVYSRKSDFTKPVDMFRILEIFGRNLISTGGDIWQQHRKVTAPSFNESRSGIVWDESIKQSDEAITFWARKGSIGTTEIHKESMTLAFHVLSNTGFGTANSFANIMDPPVSPFTMTFANASNIIRENMLVAIAIPHRLLFSPFVPTSWAGVGRAMEELEWYMTALLDKERSLYTRGVLRSGNLLESLIRGSEGASKIKGSGSEPNTISRPSKGLSKLDVIGNIYIFSLAGHETTGNSLAFAIYLLAAHPNVQAWVNEEIDYVHARQATGHDPGYNSFHRLKRCLAVFLETLRLFPTVIAVPKYTSEKEQSLTINGQLYTIPAKTLVILNVTAVHSHPQYWGDDSLIWRPARWIVSKPPSDVQSSIPATDTRPRNVFEDETLLTPKRGTFFPWSDGPRVCPGKKYAQVEFVAVLSTLLRMHRVDPVPKPGEGMEDARQRVLDVLADCGFGLTLYMRKPNSVAIKWTCR